MNTIFGRLLAAVALSACSLLTSLAVPSQANAICSAAVIQAGLCGDTTPRPAPTTAYYPSALDGLPIAVAEPEQPPVLLAGGLIALAVIGSALYLGRVLSPRRASAEGATSNASAPISVVDSVDQDSSALAAPAAEVDVSPNRAIWSLPTDTGLAPILGPWRRVAAVSAGIIASVVSALVVGLVIQGASYAPTLVGVGVGSLVAGWLLGARSVTAWIAAGASALLGQVLFGLAVALIVTALG